MKYQIPHIFGIGLLLAATGCIQSSNEYILNPDGSGKVMHRSIVHPMNFGDSSASDPEKQALSAIKALLNESSGVDTWKDVHFRRTEDKGIELSGTAYFPDLTKLKLSGGEGIKTTGSELQLFVEGSTLSLQIGKEKPKDKPSETQALPEEELFERVRQSRAEYAQSKAVLAGFLATLRMETIVHLPGTSQSIQNFEQREDGAIRLVLEGSKMLAAMDELVEDEEYLIQHMKTGKTSNQPELLTNHKAMEKMFGVSGPAKAVFVDASTPLFDYSSEVASAREGFDTMIQGLGIAMPIVSQPAAGAGFTTVEVVGVQWVYQSDAESGVNPFNQQVGYKLSLLGTLPGSVLDVAEGTLTEAIADNGDNLLPENEWDRRISFPRLSDNRNQVLFEISMNSPGADIIGIDSLAGTIEYLESGPATKLDLGIQRFSAGQKGSLLGAEIKSIGKSEWSEEIILTLEVNSPRAAIEDVKFTDSEGTILKTDSKGTMEMNDTTTFEFSAENGWPANGNIQISLHEDLTKHLAPFQVKKIDLLGRPTAGRSL